MRRISVVVAGAIVSTMVGVVVPALPAAATSVGPTVTLDSTTCGMNTPDVSISGTWSGTTCTTGVTQLEGYSTLIIPAGTTLVSPDLFNFAEVINQGTVDTCNWEDTYGDPYQGASVNLGTVNVTLPASMCPDTSAFIESGTFQNFGVFNDSIALTLLGINGVPAQFTNYCGSTYNETGPVYIDSISALAYESDCPQAIIYTGPVTGATGDAATLTATGGGSGNPVGFSLDTAHSTAGACALSGANNATVAYTGVGSCVILADQAGNAQYVAAPEVSTTIAVYAAPTLSAMKPASAAPGSRQGVTLTGTGFATGAVITGPKGVKFLVKVVRARSITATMIVRTTAPKGTGLAVTVTNNASAGKGHVTADLLTIT